MHYLHLKPRQASPPFFTWQSHPPLPSAWAQPKCYVAYMHRHWQIIYITNDVVRMISELGYYVEVLDLSQLVSRNLGAKFTVSLNDAHEMRNKYL